MVRSSKGHGSALIVKIRAPHRDARRTLTTPTRRAPHFFVRAAVRNILGSSTPDLNRPFGLTLAIAEQVKPAYKSERRGPHHDRGGSCGTATSFTPATIECALLDLANVNIFGRLECSGKVRRPQGSTRFSRSHRRQGPHQSHQEGR